MRYGEPTDRAIERGDCGDHRGEGDRQKRHRQRPLRSGDARLISHSYHAKNCDGHEGEPDALGNLQRRNGRLPVRLPRENDLYVARRPKLGHASADEEMRRFNVPEKLKRLNARGS